MGGQLYGNFLPGSLTHKFSLIVTLIICFVMNKFLSLSFDTNDEEEKRNTYGDSDVCAGYVPSSIEYIYLRGLTWVVPEK